MDQELVEWQGIALSQERITNKYTGESLDNPKTTLLECYHAFNVALGKYADKYEET